MPFSAPLDGFRAASRFSLTPEGTNKSIPITEQAGRALAYYEAAGGIAVLAPRG